eukprot:2893602-Pleurochrysis_carterae.AAC.1
MDQPTMRRRIEMSDAHDYDNPCARARTAAGVQHVLEERGSPAGGCGCRWCNRSSIHFATVHCIKSMQKLFEKL